PAADHLADLLAAACFHRDSRADGAAVRLRAGEFDGDGVLPRTGVLQEGGAVVDVRDEDLGAAVAVEVADGQSARRAQRREAGTRGGGDVGEVAVAEIAVQ